MQITQQTKGKQENTKEKEQWMARATVSLCQMSGCCVFNFSPTLVVKNSGIFKKKS